MQFSSRKNALILVMCLLGLFSANLALGKKKEQRNFVTQMDQPEMALHALNRLTFGVRPGDLERITTMGLDKWIDQQLHPERINDSALEARLSPFRTLRMDTRQIVENFPPPQLIKAVANGKQPLPSDPLKRAVYQDQIERMQEKQDRKQLTSDSDVTTSTGKASTFSDEERIDRRDKRVSADLAAQELLDMDPDQRLKAILKLSAEDRRALSNELKHEKRDECMEGMTPEQRETVMALNNPQQVVANELIQGKILRATYSERQLQEVMTDVWFNHFNIFIGKGEDRYLLTSYERDVIRPRALGKFEDLLRTTAQSPAMLFYLDNALSVGPNSDFANGISNRAYKKAGKKRNRNAGRGNQAKGKRGGLNENYGRELMELHTLGVNGGYTQKDVTEVARVFTGWTLKKPKQGEGFTFENSMHEPGEKWVLGHRIKPNGEKEGLEVLHILARHPSTAKFVSSKLAIRFVSDNPPQALVDRMAETFRKKDGDIREVLKTMLHSPEFWSADEYRSKVKTPFEFVISALRATGADIGDAVPLARQLQSLGMPLYGMQPPTGYSMKADAWMSSAALLGRMNFALALTSGKLKGLKLDPGYLLGTNGTASDPQQTLAVLENNLLAADISRQTHDTIATQLQDAKLGGRLGDQTRLPSFSVIAGLLLGSPEFQKR
ncbi:MAG: hypothetical protein AUH15_09060 [Acidobacteriales bacterium 13_2_20CM_55_8]|nr:MAG: hypothetical protein AUH15_09060 [Acidobacteriales bacterium 13_2_20CM_55_8]